MQITRFGGPDVLDIVGLPAAVAGEDDARVQLSRLVDAAHGGLDDGKMIRRLRL